MTSRPLLARVAESIVILAPIVQVGCLSACSGVTTAISSARGIEEWTARCGEHEGSHGRHGFADEALPDGRMLRIDRAEPGQRAGERIAGLGLARASREAASEGHDQVAARDEGFLVGGGHDLAGPRARRGPVAG